MVWQVVAAIGGAVLGGIARNKAIKKQNALNAAAYDAERNVFRGRFEEIRDDAERGGFNPLTALRSGALSAYGNPSRIPETAQSSVALQAAQAGLQAWAQAPALAREKERFELENQLIRENILSSQAQRKLLNTKAVFGSALTTEEVGIGTNVNDIIQSKLPLSAAAQGALNDLGIASVQGIITKDRIKGTVERYVNSDGYVLGVPVGPEMDEAFMGAVLETTGKVDQWLKRNVGFGINTIGKNIPNVMPTLIPTYGYLRRIEK